MSDPIQQLHEIPDLATEVFLTWNHPNPALSQTGITRRPAPGSRPPTDLAVLDALRPDPDAAGRSVRGILGMAVRAVWEHGRDWQLSVPALITDPSIVEDCGWLLTTAGVWRADRWLYEYVTKHVADVHRELRDLARVQPEVVFWCQHLAYGKKCRAPMHLINGGAMMRCIHGHEVAHWAAVRAELEKQDLPLGECLATVARHWQISPPAREVVKKWAQRGLFGEPERVGGKRMYNVGRVRRALQQRTTEGLAG